MPETDAGARRLLIVSNRLPITMRKRGGSMTVERSAGGLATGLRAPHERSGGLWIGWPGDLDSFDNAAVFEARRQLHVAVSLLSPCLDMVGGPVDAEEEIGTDEHPAERQQRRIAVDLAPLADRRRQSRQRRRPGHTDDVVGVRDDVLVAFLGDHDRACPSGGDLLDVGDDLPVQQVPWPWRDDGSSSRASRLAVRSRTSLTRWA